MTLGRVGGCGCGCVGQTETETSCANLRVREIGMAEEREDIGRSGELGGAFLSLLMVVGCELGLL